MANGCPGFLTPQVGRPEMYIKQVNSFDDHQVGDITTFPMRCMIIIWHTR